MNSMIERVAKAMFRRAHDEPWEQAEAIVRPIYLADARAAIEAMKEPTLAIYAAIDEAMSVVGTPSQIWRAAITAALDDATEAKQAGTISE